MKTTVSSASKEVVIGTDTTVLIGERINPTGKKMLAEELRNGKFDIVTREAREQVEAGALILDVNVGTGGVNEAALLPETVKAVIEEVDVPLCIDSGDPSAIEAALKVYKGKPIINSVNGEEISLDRVLPLVKSYGTAVIALLKDENGIPNDFETRLKIAEKIVARCGKMGIPVEDIIMDCLAISVAVDNKAGLVTLETIRGVKERFGCNVTLGASNVSFSLPGREIVNSTFLPLAIEAGLTCPVVDAAKVKKSVVAADLVLGRDRFAQKYLSYYRQHKDNFSSL